MVRGEGGMGIVYKAEHTRLDRLVALKSVVSGLLESNEPLERFAREAKAAATLDHPNITPDGKWVAHFRRPLRSA